MVLVFTFELWTWIFKIMHDCKHNSRYDDSRDFFFLQNISCMHWNCSKEAIPLSTHKRCFGAKIAKKQNKKKKKKKKSSVIVLSGIVLTVMHFRVCVYTRAFWSCVYSLLNNDLISHIWIFAVSRLYHVHTCLSIYCSQLQKYIHNVSIAMPFSNQAHFRWSMMI